MVWFDLNWFGLYTQRVAGSGLVQIGLVWFELFFAFGVVVDFYYSDMPETYNLIAKYKSVYKMTGRAIVGL